MKLKQLMELSLVVVNNSLPPKINYKLQFRYIDKQINLKYKLILFYLASQVENETRNLEITVNSKE